MTNTDNLRLVLLLSETDNSSFNKNLLKYIEVIMFETNHTDYSVEQIISLIKNRFHMEYSDAEVASAINSRRSGKRTIIRNSKTNRYFLSPEKFQSMNNSKSADNFDSIIQEFLDKNTSHLYSLSEAKDLLYNFFLHTINENITSLLELLNRQPNTVFATDIPFFDDKQRAFINVFLNWDNSDKNKYVYKVISFCWDYCTLTLKSDNSSFRHLFNNKVFFLDSNVIFRLYGINNKERKAVIEAFINKCEHVGITLKYTNFTYTELMESIHRNISAVSFITQNKKPLGIKSYQYFVNGNTDFIEQYCIWCKENNSTDIKKFEESVKSGISSILRRFKRFDGLDFSRLQLSSQFSIYQEDLLDYKRKNRANNVHPNSVAIDINNWLNIREIRQQEKGTDMRSISTFAISTDGHFCGWSKKMIPGGIPLVVKPSVWHSILLKLGSRSDNDFKAFLAFLNLRFSEDFRHQDDRRPRILARVIEKNYEPELSDRVLDYIDSKLITDYNNIDDIDFIVSDANEKVIASIKDEAIEESKDQYLEEGFSQGIDEGEKRTYERLASRKANRRISQFDTFRKVRAILGVLFVILTACSLAYIVYMKQLPGFLFWMNSNVYQWNPAHWLALINLSFSLLTTIPNKCLNYITDYYFENGNVEKLKGRFMRDMLEKKREG